MNDICSEQFMAVHQSQEQQYCKEKQYLFVKKKYNNCKLYKLT